MKSYRGRKKRIIYTIARRLYDHPDGWDYFWDEIRPSKRSAAPQQRAMMKRKLETTYAYMEDVDGPNRQYRLCKITFEIVD